MVLPTRELALQTFNFFKTSSKFTDLTGEQVAYQLSNGLFLVELSPLWTLKFTVRRHKFSLS